MLLVVIAGIASSGQDDATEGATGTTAAASTTSTTRASQSATTAVPTTTIDRGLGSSDATRDVTILACPAVGGNRSFDNWGEPKVRITNNSSKRSNYSIEFVTESADGKTRYESGYFYVSDLDPGQSYEDDSLLTKTPADAVCRLTRVQRTAS